MGLAVAKTLRSVTTTPADAGAVQLVTEYARLLDEAMDLGEGVKTFGALGPRLLAGLRELGGTPAGRAPAAGGDGAGAAPDAARGVVVELRGRAAERQRRAAAVDTAAS